MQKIAIILILLININTIFSEKTLASDYANYTYKEKDYQHIWCKQNNGIEEYENPDCTRVDCLTQTHAIEFDFDKKWAECIGQALHYGIQTGKKPKCVLILRGNNPARKKVYFQRIKTISEKYGFEVEYITDEILNNKNCNFRH